jgi:hypothetical protein
MNMRRDYENVIIKAWHSICATNCDDDVRQ